MVEIDIGPDLLSSGQLVLSWHGFYSFIAVATAVILVGRWASLRGVRSDDIYSIATWGIIAGVIGARMVHVIDEWDFYSNSPGQILQVWSGGIGGWGRPARNELTSTYRSRFSCTGSRWSSTATATVCSVRRISSTVRGSRYEKVFMLEYGLSNRSTARFKANRSRERRYTGAIATTAVAMVMPTKIVTSRLRSSANRLASSIVVDSGFTDICGRRRVEAWAYSN